MSIVVVGDVMNDIVVVPEGPLRRGTDQAATITALPGGSGANQALWLAYFGGRPRLAARVGHADAAPLREKLSNRGVDTHLAADSAHPTGNLICIIDPDGERSFFSDRGANRFLNTQDLPDALLEDVAHLHVSGYALVTRTARHATHRLIEVARARAISVSADPGSAGFLADIGPRTVLDALAGATMVFPNVDEATVLTGENEAEAQCRALAGHFDTVVLKRGEAGAMVATQDGGHIARAAVPARSIDSTGAGDAFCAAFLAAHLRGEAIEQALDHALAAGAHAVTIAGGQPPSDPKP